MNEHDLERRLRRTPVDEDAGARGWEMVASAYRAREPVARRRGRGRPALAVATALVAIAVLAAALTAPGRAVVRSVREAIGITTPASQRATLARLPTERSLLVDSTSGAWLVRPTGALRRLGDYQETSWSPRGLYVAAIEGNELLAIEPNGTVRWRLVRPTAVATPRWSPSGYRIAYTEGGAVRVVAGDGTRDRRVATNVPQRSPALAWQPTTEQHVLAYADREGRVTLLDTDRLERLWTTPPESTVRDLCFTGSGRELVVLRGRSVTITRADTGHTVVRRPLGVGHSAIACDPTSSAVALATPAAADQTAIKLLESGGSKVRTVFRGTGRIETVAFAGRRLLASWPTADQWLFLPLQRGGQIVAVSRIRDLFDTTVGPFPTISGVCCARR